MQFADAINSIDASNEAANAMKIPEWEGYVYKTTDGVSTSDVEAGKFKLVFVKSNGAQYVYLFDGVSDYTYVGYIAPGSSGALGSGSPVAGTKLEQDPDLLEAYLSQNWEIGSADVFDARRTGDRIW